MPSASRRVNHRAMFPGLRESISFILTITSLETPCSNAASPCTTAANVQRVFDVFCMLSYPSNSDARSEAAADNGTPKAFKRAGLHDMLERL